MRAARRVWWVLSLAGCLAEGPVSEPAVATREAAIIGGEPLERGQFPAVVAIILPTGGTCTGTLISPTLVLTAAHCLTPLPPGIPDDAAVARQTQVYVDAVHVCGPDRAARLVPAARVLRHPDYSFPPPRHDIGVVVLAEPLLDRAPIAVSLAPEVPVDGEPITVVGYGVSDAARQMGCEGHSVTGLPANQGQCAAAMPDFLEAFVCLDQSAGRGTCSGDSGGPYLATIDGQQTVVGVVSAGSIDCRGIGYGPRTGGEAEFLEHVLAGRLGLCRADGACEPGCPADPDCEAGDAAVPDMGAADQGVPDAALPAEDAGASAEDMAGSADVPDRAIQDRGAADDAAVGPDAAPAAGGDDDEGCRAAPGTRGAVLWVVVLGLARRRRCS